MKFWLRYLLLNIVVILCIGFPAFSQQKVTIEEYETTQKLIKGKIDTGGPITLYLKFHSYSTGHSDIYSVKGWYYYDKYKKQIPLAGVYNNGLYLYQFEDEKQIDTVLNFRYDNYNKRRFWEATKLYKDISTYKEKFVCLQQDTKSTYSGTWKDKEKELSVALYTRNIAVKEQYSLLKIVDGDKDHTINLANFGLSKEGNSVWKYKWTNGNLRVLIQYDYPSKFYKLGMCGAGTEGGFYALEFDENYQLVEMERYELYSCLLSFDYKEIYNQSDKIIYEVKNWEGVNRQITVHKQTLKVN